VDSEGVNQLRTLARGAVSQKFFHHYRGFFGRMCEDFRAAQPKTVKGLLYAYRSALTGIHLLRTGECIGDVTQLAPIYGFSQVPELVARKGRGREHGELTTSTGFDADLERLEALLETARSESPLPPESPNTEALNEFLVEQRMGRSNDRRGRRGLRRRSLRHELVRHAVEALASEPSPHHAHSTFTSWNRGPGRDANVAGPARN
jgi:hypothetical protein